MYYPLWTLCVVLRAYIYMYAGVPMQWWSVSLSSLTWYFPHLLDYDSPGCLEGRSNAKEDIPVEICDCDCIVGPGSWCDH